MLLTVAMTLLAACGPSEKSATPTAVPAATSTPESVAAIETATAVPPTETAAPLPTDTPTAAPTAVPSEIPAPAGIGEFVAADCAFSEPPGYDVSCGYVTVPETHADPENGRTLRLHIATFASDNPNPAPDPIVYLEGGPGGDALETIPLIFADRFAPFLTNHTFIMFDQRGTGYSEPSLACPEYTDLAYNSLEMDITPEEELDLTLNTLLTCRERLIADGVNLAAYNSAENAADVDMIRQALGYDQWNLLGVSYGTRLAQTILRDYPAGVRSVILDSTYPIDADLVTELPANVHRAFTVFFAGCAADPDCAAAYPDLETTFFTLVEQLNETPITVPVTNLFTRTNYDALIHGDDLLGIVFQSLYSAEVIPVLPQLITQVAAGETQQMGLLMSSFLLNTEFFSIGMQYAVQCQEENAFSQPGDGAAAAAEFPELAAPFTLSANLDEAVCAAWDVGTADPRENEAISSDIPALVLAGEYDPITPPAWGEQVAAGLNQAYFFVYPGQGHGVSLSAACAQEMALAFFADPATPPADACIATLSGPDFATESSSTADIALVPFTADLIVTQVNGVRPESWTEVGPGTFARQETALDQTVVLAQAIPGMTGADMLNLLSTQLGLSETPSSSGTYDAPNRTWTLYAATLQGLPVDIGIAEEGETSFVVLLISTEEEREGLITAVFYPIMDSLAIP